MVSNTGDQRPIVACLPSKYTWESLRLRFVSYGLGTVDFVTNASINIREALNCSSQAELDPVTFQDKARFVQLVKFSESSSNAFPSV